MRFNPWQQPDGSDSESWGDTFGGNPSTGTGGKKGERHRKILAFPPPAIILVSEEQLVELDVICMCVFEEGCS